ncbi:MAG: hypothetical protein ACIAQZ_07030 [Sedimentisphaeraceae bacterium JB056]
MLQGCGEVTHFEEHECEGFAAAEVSVNRLTEITYIDDYNEYAKIDAFVSLSDKFGVKLKSPGILRFELYEFKSLSANEVGRMIYSWPVIDITDSAVNNEYWRDSLRCYMFELELQAKLAETEKYVLSVTFSNPKQQLRFSDKREIQYYDK